MLQFSQLYDRKYLVKCLAQLAMIVVLMKVTHGAGFVVVLPIIFYCLAMKKVEGLFFWLLVTVCLMIGNGNIVSKNVLFFWTQRVLMLLLGGCMAVQVFGYAKHRVMKPYLGIILYLLFMAVSSAQGWAPMMSYLKLLLFVLVYFSYFGVANQVGINPRVSSRRIRSVMLAVAIFFILGSVALLPFPALSQLKVDQFLAMGGSLEDLKYRTSLFTGMANHSQCLGPVISALFVILLGDMLFSIRKFDSLYAVLLLCCPYLVYKTSSRTGMGALLVGSAFVVFLFMQARGVGSRWKSRVVTGVMLVLVVGLFLVACVPNVQRGIRKFMTKFGGENSTTSLTTEEVFRTRQGKAEEGLANFRKSPLIGNGFQVGEDMKGMQAASLLSAPIEKGVWVTAVLEEGGVIGFMLFVGFLVICILTSVKRKAYIGASALFLMTLTNLGEFTFFSMSYSGGFSWAMVFVGLALDMRKMKDENDELRRKMMEWQMQLGMQMGDLR